MGEGIAEDERGAKAGADADADAEFGARAGRAAPARRPGRPDRIDLVVCRGCCCGTDKHPDVDHARHLAELRATAEAQAGARVLVADCLNRCDFSNVVAVRHRPAEGKARTVWLGAVLADDDVSALREYVAGLAESGGVTLPPSLERRRIPSPLEARQALQELISAAGRARAE